jgi:hypothetical protein
MAIMKEQIVCVAAVFVTEEFRVEVQQMKRRWDYSPDEAIELATEMLEAAETAKAQMEAHITATRTRILKGSEMGMDS